MARLPDATPGWDPLAPTAGLQPTRDALAGGYGAVNAGWYAGDALAVGYGGAPAGADPLSAVGYSGAGPAGADPLSAVGYGGAGPAGTDPLSTVGAAFGSALGNSPAGTDPLSTVGAAFGPTDGSPAGYADPTAPGDAPRWSATRATPRPGPVPPGPTGPAAAGSDARSTAPPSRRARPATRGTRGRPSTGTAAGADRTARSGPGTAGGSGRTAQSGGRTAGAGSTGRSGPGTAAGSDRTAQSAGRTAGAGWSGRSGAGTADRPGAAAQSGAGRSAGPRRGPTWEELNRIGPPPPQARPYDRTPAGPVRGRRGLPVPPPPWGDGTSRPTGTVPWSGRSGWDDFFAGMGDSAGGSRTPPSGADVARALLEAFRRGLRRR
jgi:hypothetical protein